MATYYVAPAASGGSDSNPGTELSPFLTLQKAHDVANPGDTIYMRAGTYPMPAQTVISRNGSSGNLIKVFNYPGEVPILDGSSNPNTGSHSIIQVNDASYWHFKGLELKSSPGHGILLRTNASNIIVEFCNVHHNIRLDDSGAAIQIQFGSNNLILNNDVHHNGHSPSEGGTGIDIASQGTGNILRGNRVWRNNDNGISLWDAANVLVETNWAWENGYDDSLASTAPGDGVGFKLGGSGSGDGGHTIRNNLSWNNRFHGFDENGADNPMDVFNNTSYNNGGYNFEFDLAIAYVLKNNLSVSGNVNIHVTVDDTFNSWNLAVTVTSGDFATLDFTANTGSRQADGSLPSSNFLKLVAGSDLINAGTDVGIAYNGSAPDLGAQEFVSPVAKHTLTVFRAVAA